MMVAVSTLLAGIACPIVGDTKAWMGEFKEGLHRVEGQVRPGIALLEGSQVKALEEESYGYWQQQQQQQHRQQQQPHRNWVAELEFGPFTEQELLALNKPVPKIKVPLLAMFREYASRCLPPRPLYESKSKDQAKLS